MDKTSKPKAKNKNRNQYDMFQSQSHNSFSRGFHSNNHNQQHFMPDSDHEEDNPFFSKQQQYRKYKKVQFKGQQYDNRQISSSKDQSRGQNSIQQTSQSIQHQRAVQFAQNSTNRERSKSKKSTLKREMKHEYRDRHRFNEYICLSNSTYQSLSNSKFKQKTNQKMRKYKEVNSESIHEISKAIHHQNKFTQGQRRSELTLQQKRESQSPLRRQIDIGVQTQSTQTSRNHEIVNQVQHQRTQRMHFKFREDTRQLQQIKGANMTHQVRFQISDEDANHDNQFKQNKKSNQFRIQSSNQEVLKIRETNNSQKLHHTSKRNRNDIIKQNSNYNDSNELQSERLHQKRQKHTINHKNYQRDSSDQTSNQFDYINYDQDQRTRKPYQVDIDNNNISSFRGSDTESSNSSDSLNQSNHQNIKRGLKQQHRIQSNQPKMYQVHQRSRGSRRTMNQKFHPASGGHTIYNSKPLRVPFDGESGGGTGEGFRIKLYQTELFENSSDYSSAIDKNEDEFSRAYQRQRSPQALQKENKHNRLNRKYGYQISDDSSYDRNENILSNQRQMRQADQFCHQRQYPDQMMTKNSLQFSSQQRNFSTNNRNDKDSKSQSRMRVNRIVENKQGKKSRQMNWKNKVDFESDEHLSSDDNKQWQQKGKDENSHMYEYDFTPLTKQSRVLRRGRGRRVELKNSDDDVFISSVPEKRNLSDSKSYTSQQQSDQIESQSDHENYESAQKRSKTEIFDQKIGKNQKIVQGKFHKIVERSGGRGQRKQIVRSKENEQSEDDQITSKRLNQNQFNDSDFFTQMDRQKQQQFQKNVHQNQEHDQRKSSTYQFKNRSKLREDRFEDAIYDQEQQMKYQSNNLRSNFKEQNNKQMRYQNKFKHNNNDFDQQDDENYHFQTSNKKNQEYFNDTISYEIQNNQYNRKKNDYKNQLQEKHQRQSKYGFDSQYSPQDSNKKIKNHSQTYQNHHKFHSDREYSQPELQHNKYADTEKRIIKGNNYQIHKRSRRNYEENHYQPDYYSSEEQNSNSSLNNYQSDSSQYQKSQVQGTKYKDKKSNADDAQSSIRSQSSQNIDIYTPKAEKRQNNNGLKILRRYEGFTEPSFYQGSQWRFVRQSTNQNSKQKHYEKGDYDQVQYYSPNADFEENNTDGEQKVFPPIDEFSDDDCVSPSSLNLKAKGKSFTNESDEDDDDFQNNNKNISAEFLLADDNITLDFAKNFFLQDKEDNSKVEDQHENQQQLYEKYLEDWEQIEQNLKQGKLWQGIIKIQSKYKNRAFVSIPELNFDIQIEGTKNINRAIDGDQVIVELISINQWFEKDQIQKYLQSQNISDLNNKDQNYTNETAIESRTIDIDHEKSIKVDSKENVNNQINNQDLKKKIESSKNSKLKSKRFLEIDDEQYEGYIASNSDNNAENLAKFAIKKRNDSILSHSSLDVQNNDKQNLEISKIFETNEQKSQVDGLNELQGNKSQIINQINSYSEQLRPVGKIVALKSSYLRQQPMIVTLSQQFVQTCKNNQNQFDHDRQSKGETFIYAQPINKKLPMFQVSSIPQELIDDRKNGRQLSHRYYIAKFKDWKLNKRRPVCEITESIGEAGNLQAETLRILLNNEICVEEYQQSILDDNQGSQNDYNPIFESLKVFKKNVDKTSKEWIIPKNEIQQRLDLRQKRIFSIDPITAKDLDDALSIDKINENIYEIGVHIADVSYFVKQGSDLDQEARKRSTSTYLVHKVFPMLPPILSEYLCSLNPRVDRLAYSIFFRLDMRTGQLVQDHKPEIKRTVIRSCAKWNYDLAQKILDNKLKSEDQLEQEMKPSDGHKFIDLAQDVLRLHQIAQVRRKERLSSGSLVFEKEDFTFILNDETNQPVVYKESPSMFSKELVEEYMLTANVLVAEYLFEHCQDRTLLRAHSDITNLKKNNLRELFDTIGLESIDISNSLTLAKSIEQLKDSNEPQQLIDDKNQIIQRHMFHNLNIAFYTCVDNLQEEDYRHYGLNFDKYTHFTSPIRRYADLLVHRLLTICLREGKNTRETLKGLDYSEYAAEISDKSYNARKASRECVQLFHCILLKQNGPYVFESLIYDLEYGRIKIFIAELNMDLYVDLKDDIRVDYITFNSEQMLLACHFRQPLKLSSKIKEYKGDSQFINQKFQTFKEISKSKQINTADTTSEIKNMHDLNLKESCVFKVLDRVKVKLTATDSYPLDIVCQVIITEEDEFEYKKIFIEQNEKLSQLRQMVSHKGDGTKI